MDYHVRSCSYFYVRVQKELPARDPGDGLYRHGFGIQRSYRRQSRPSDSHCHWMCGLVKVLFGSIRNGHSEENGIFTRTLHVATTFTVCNR